MKRGLLAGICLLFGSLSVAQTIDTQAEIDWYGTDRRINDAFARVGDPVSAFIFYAPKLREDVVLGEEGLRRSEKSFYANPPFEVSYAPQVEKPLYGKEFTLRRSGDQFWVSYPVSVSVPAGKPVEIEGQVWTFTTRAAGLDKGAETLPVQVSGGSDSLLRASFVFKTRPVSSLKDLEAPDSLDLTYTHTLAAGADGRFEAEGFGIQITDKSMAEGKAYTFRITEVKFMPLVVVMLILGALYFTLYFRFVNFRKFRLAIGVVRGKYSNAEHLGEVSHFQALATALSGTIGLGNIAGVAIAISIGGPGATFWMILAGLLGMSSKFVECTLGVAYRNIDERGEVSGGPMYYLSKGFAEKGMPRLGRALAIFFAIMCVGGALGGGNMFQSNQSFQQISTLEFVSGTWLAENGWAFGLFMAVMTAVVIIGGIQSIARVTDKMVPFMCGVYLLAGIFILGVNFRDLPFMVTEIFEGAFAPTAVAGGFIGVMIQGFRRAAFSNEAGVGSASIAHSAVRTDYPASEGIVSLLEPFIDTVIVCTTTALVIIATGSHLEPGLNDGAALTTRAFASQIPFFKYILTLSVLLFAFSTIISWSYYGLKAWTYLFGHTRLADLSFKLLFCLFIIIGAAANLNSVTDFSDAMIFAMAIPNIVGLVVLAPKVQTELDRYLAKINAMDEAAKAQKDQKPL